MKKHKHIFNKLGGSIDLNKKEFEYEKVYACDCGQLIKLLCQKAEIYDTLKEVIKVNKL